MSPTRQLKDTPNVRDRCEGAEKVGLAPNRLFVS